MPRQSWLVITSRREWSILCAPPEDFNTYRKFTTRSIAISISSRVEFGVVWWLESGIKYRLCHLTKALNDTAGYTKCNTLKEACERHENHTIRWLRCLPTPRERHRASFNQISGFNRGRIVAFRDCGLSFRGVDQRVGGNQETVKWICHCEMQDRLD
ncbi:hypothetical protein TNCV_271941 [Trichonephila clavipes]|nr:hypothetical protein TNCV_271941 [Trichonephila clavipes]